MSDRVALFNAGRIEQLGTGRDLYEAPASRFVAGFIGNSNFLDGKLSRTDRSIVLPDGTALRGLALDKVDARQDTVAVMIRPDHFRLHDAASDAPKFSGTVTGATYLGDHTHLAVALPWGQTLTVRLPPGSTVVERGRPIALTCAPVDLRVF